jgi:hypothetical protein
MVIHVASHMLFAHRCGVLRLGARTRSQLCRKFDCNYVKLDGNSVELVMSFAGVLNCRRFLRSGLQAVGMNFDQLKLLEEPSIFLIAMIVFSSIEHH